MSSVEQESPFNEFPLSETMTLALMGESKLLELPSTNEARSQRIDDAFGDEARTLVFHEGGAMRVGIQQTLLREGSNTRRGVMNVLREYPDVWVPLSIVAKVSLGSPNTIVKRMNACFYEPIIETHLEDNRAYVRLAQDLKMVDDFVIKVEETPKPEPKGLQLGRHAGVIGRLMVDDTRLFKGEIPATRHGIILNAPELNGLTDELLEFKARRSPEKAAPQAGELDYIDDFHANHNSVPYDVGPFATSALHGLLSCYLTPEHVDIPVYALANPEHDDHNYQRKIQIFMQSLLVRGMVAVEARDENGILVIEKARLNPVRITDRRLG